MKCLQKVGEENLETEFKKFYSVESHDAQRALICSMVNEVPIKRKRNKASEKKKFSRIYKVSGHIVCKPFFIQSLRISSCKIDAALKAAKRPGGVRDFRGKGACKNKTDDIKVQEVTEHINKFPRYKSHYRRSQTERESTVMKILRYQQCMNFINKKSLTLCQHLFIKRYFSQIST